MVASDHRRRGGFTLIEVLVALVVLLAGIIAIVQLFPTSLEANADAALVGTAVNLGQRKVEEIRRDRDRQASLVLAIKNRTTPTTPVPFAEDPRLTYSFSGESLLDPSPDPGDPRDDKRVPRIIVRHADNYRKGGKVLYELRFDR